MPFIKSSAFKRRLRLVSLILFFSKIMPLCSCCMKKRLSYIAISALSGRQPSFYTKCTSTNIRSSCNIKLISAAKCTRPIYLINL